MVASVGQALSAADVTRVLVTVSAPDIVPSRTAELTRTNDQWQGVIGAIPAGSGRTFVAQAYDGSNRLLFSGQATNVTITAGATVVVSITLQPEQGGPPSGNVAPIIDALIASASSAQPGETLTLQATAHDPNPGDLLTYGWSATAGTFGQLIGNSTTWTAPQTPGLVTLRLTVTDPHGAASSMDLTIPVQVGVGSAEVIIRLNTWPHISGITVSPSPVAVGQVATAQVSAGDAEGDALSYTWSASGCTGSWQGASQSLAHFTPDALPAGTPCSCSLTVAVSDGQGGQTSRSMALCVQSSTGLPQPPVVTEAFQSATTVPGGANVTLRVAATTAQGGSLTFTWNSNEGTLGTPSTSTGRSEVVWTAPACVPLGTTPTIQVTIRDEQGLSTLVTFTVAGVLGCGPQGPRSSPWTFLGGLGVLREQHSAALLPSGKVLLVGVGEQLRSNRAEVYDGVAHVSAPTGPTVRARGKGTTLTVLSNGKVLLAGGWSSETYAELYDPATETWALTGSMMTARTGHTATRLTSGKVLVVGGTSTASAEVYDPATGTWTLTSPMSAVRNQHEATLLPSGSVLVTGGTGEASAEVYDPATGTWSSTSSMSVARAGHTATLLDSGKVLVAGGSRNGVAVLTAELYDPVTRTWSATSPMTGPRSGHKAVRLPSGDVFVAGGNNGGALNTAELYAPGTGTWSAVAAMRYAHQNHTLTLLPSGKPLVAGGGSMPGTTELYDPVAGQWTSTSVPRSIDPTSGIATALLPTGEVFVPTSATSMQLFNPATMQWTPLTGAVPTNTTVTLLDSGELFVLGFTNAYLYERSTDTWTALTPLAGTVQKRTATQLHSGRVLVVGGSNVATGQLFDLASQTWLTTSPLNVPRASHSALLLPSGQVMVMGGTTVNGPTPTVELYDSSTDTWTVAPPMRISRTHPAFTLLPSGQVLVAGGAEVELYDPATATWSAMPSPPQGLDPVVAAMVDASRVLLVGREDAALFDLDTRTWTPAGSIWGVQGHMSQRLASGKLLVIRTSLTSGLVPALYTP